MKLADDDGQRQLPAGLVFGQRVVSGDRDHRTRDHPRYHRRSHFTSTLSRSRRMAFTQPRSGAPALASDQEKMITDPLVIRRADGTVTGRSGAADGSSLVCCADTASGSPTKTAAIARTTFGVISLFARMPRRAVSSNARAGSMSRTRRQTHHGDRALRPAGQGTPR